MRIRTWSRTARPNGGVALAALLSGAFVITAGFGGPVGEAPSTSTASAETCALEQVTPTGVVVGLTAARPSYDVTFSGCSATWSISWPTAGLTATQASPRGTIDARKLAGSAAGGSNLYVTLRADDETSSRTAVKVSLRRRTVWAKLRATPDPGRRGGTITLSSSLGRADWEAGVYRGYAGRPVTVMFRGTGAKGFSSYRTTRTGTGGRLRVQVPAKKSGAWALKFAGNSVAAPAVSGANLVRVLPVARTYANCTALNRVYPHGVGKAGARDRVTGSTDPVTNFTRDSATYRLNAKSDRDDDDIACEKL